MKILLLLLLFSFSPSHEVLYSLEKREAVILKVYFSDGTPVAYAPYEVYAPSDGKTPWQKGRTDRMGYLVFYPVEEGEWRVRVLEEGGHGLDISVRVSDNKAVEYKQTYPTYIKLLVYLGLFFPTMMFLYLLTKLLRRYRR